MHAWLIQYQFFFVKSVLSNDAEENSVMHPLFLNKFIDIIIIIIKLFISSNFYVTHMCVSKFLMN